MDFETRVRKTIKDLVEPVIMRGQEDREMLFKLNSKRKKFQERLGLVEATLFGEKEVTTLFDDIEFKIENLDAKFRKDYEKLIIDMNKRFSDVHDRIFETNSRITQNEILKQQFEVFVEKQEAADARLIDFQNDMHAEFSRLQHDVNSEKFETVSQLQYLKNKFTALTPTIESLNQKVEQQSKSITSMEIRFDKLEKDFIQLDHSKISSAEYLIDQKKILDAVNSLQNSDDAQVNTFKTLENWIEKYQPLKIQHQIFETLNCCLNRKAKIKLADFDMKVCEQLRQKILDDFGHPQLKSKILDLIIMMEKEASQINEQAADYFNSKKNSGDPNYHGDSYHHNKRDDLEDDSEGLEELRDEIQNDLNRRIEELDFRIRQYLQNEIDKQNSNFEQHVLRSTKRVEEIQIYQNQLKDDQDRQGDKIRNSYSELLTLNKGLVSNLKKLKTDQRHQFEDIAQADTLIHQCIDCCAIMFEQLEFQLDSINEIKSDNGLVVQPAKKSQGVNTSYTNKSIMTLDKDNITKGLEIIKRCEIMMYKKKLQNKRQMNQSLDAQGISQVKNLQQNSYRKNTNQIESRRKQSIAQNNSNYLGIYTENSSCPVLPDSNENLGSKHRLSIILGQNEAGEGKVRQTFDQTETANISQNQESQVRMDFPKVQQISIEQMQIKNFTSNIEALNEIEKEIGELGKMTSYEASRSSNKNRKHLNYINLKLGSQVDNTSTGFKTIRRGNDSCDLGNSSMASGGLIYVGTSSKNQFKKTLNLKQDPIISLSTTHKQRNLNGLNTVLPDITQSLQDKSNLFI